MKSELITVVETTSLVADAKDCMTDDERTEAINMIAAKPECGDVVPDGEGIRKVRFAIGGKGKRGGVRIIYYFHNQLVPVFLLACICKKRSGKFDASRNEYAGQCS